jgi:hypothetical protein
MAMERDCGLKSLRCPWIIPEVRNPRNGHFAPLFLSSAVFDVQNTYGLLALRDERAKRFIAGEAGKRRKQEVRGRNCSIEIEKANFKPLDSSLGVTWKRSR